METAGRLTLLVLDADAVPSAGRRAHFCNLIGKATGKGSVVLLSGGWWWRRQTTVGSLGTFAAMRGRSVLASPHHFVDEVEVDGIGRVPPQELGTFKLLLSTEIKVHCY